MNDVIRQLFIDLLYSFTFGWQISHTRQCGIARTSFFSRSLYINLAGCQNSVFYFRFFIDVFLIRSISLKISLLSPYISGLSLVL